MLTTSVVAAATEGRGAPDGLAVAALIISIIALVWNIALTFARWPRIAVDIRTSALIQVAGDVEYSYLVSATNAGAEPTTVWNVGLAVKGSARGHYYASVENERANGRIVKGPELPATLPPRSTITWTFDDTVTKGPEVGTVTVGVVLRFRPIRPWHRRDELPWVEYRSTRSAKRS